MCSAEPLNDIWRLMLDWWPRYWRVQHFDPFVSLSISGVIVGVDVVASISLLYGWRQQHCNFPFVYSTEYHVIFAVFLHHAPFSNKTTTQSNLFSISKLSSKLVALLLLNSPTCLRINHTVLFIICYFYFYLFLLFLFLFLDFYHL